METKQTPKEFLETFSAFYGMLYDGTLELSSKAWNEAMNRFDAIFERKDAAEIGFFQAVVAERGDVFSSDRECVAYALAAGLV